MENRILVRSIGSGYAELLESKILELKEEFSKEGVEIHKEIKKSLEFGAIGTLFIAIGAGVATGLILRLFDKLFGKNEDVKNINIQINIKESKIVFKLPEDKQKLLDHFKKKDE